MTDDRQTSRDRHHELYAEHVLFGVEGEEFGELKTLQGPFAEEELEFELAAASVQFAYANPDDSALPISVRERVMSRLLPDTDFADTQASAKSATREEAAKPVAPSSAAGAPTIIKTQGFQFREAIAWIAAAAALVGLVLVWPRGGEREAEVPVSLSMAEQRDQFLSTVQDTVSLEWSTTDDPAAESASGDIVWSDSAQKGFMRFRGLPANDATVQQYQLWIFDRQRDDAKPVDGGVFDIPSGQDEVIIPIDSKLAVSEAFQFAITIERPGGVVVSDRQRLPLLAAVE